jgi:four helix bundle protein
MKYTRFEDLPAWQDAIRLAQAIFKLTRTDAFRHQWGLADQLQRAAIPVSNNVAEGFERGTVRELLQFIYYAKGSAGGVRSMCHALCGLEGFAAVQTKVGEALALSESISRQLGAWVASQRGGRVSGSRCSTE